MIYICNVNALYLHSKTPVNDPTKIVIRDNYWKRKLCILVLRYHSKTQDSRKPSKQNSTKSKAWERFHVVEMLNAPTVDITVGPDHLYDAIWMWLFRFCGKSLIKIELFVIGPDDKISTDPSGEMIVAGTANFTSFLSEAA